jgi:hypothetical protein
MYYKTDGAWGTGLHARLTAAQVDSNFYELRSDVDYLIAHPPEAISLYSISQSGTQLTFTLTDSSTMGPFVLPVLAWRFRSEGWSASQVFEALDVFAIDAGGANDGIYLVLRDHTSAATFDPDEVGSVETAGSFHIGGLYVIESVGTTNFTAIGASANAVGTEFKASGVGSGTGTAKPRLYKRMIGRVTSDALSTMGDVVVTSATGGDVLIWNSTDTAWENAQLTLNAAVDVTITSAANNDFLKYNGSQWVNVTPATAAAALPAMVGDSGSGGTKGLVPAPASGDAAAGKVLKADGTWGTVSGSVDSAAIDSAFGSTRGSVLYRGASGWTILAPGTSGYFLRTNGSGADPQWAAGGGGGSSTLAELTDVSLSGTASNDFLKYNGSQWVNVTPATAAAALPAMVGDSGSGGKVLGADGSFVLPPQPHPGFIPGRYYTRPMKQQGSNVTVTANTLYASPIFIPMKTTFTKLACFVVTSAAGTSCELGVYNTSGGLPNALIIDGGSVSSATTGAKEITGLTITLDVGWYWLVVTSSGAPVLRCAGTADYLYDLGVTVAGSLQTPPLGVTGSWTFSANSLPSTFPSPSISAAVFPLAFIGL